MKITIESTPYLTIDPFENKPCKVWKGITERGTVCVLFVRSLAVADNQDVTEFERELQELDPPARQLDRRQIL